MANQTLRKTICCASGLLALAIVSGCSEPNTYAPPPPPTVTVSKPIQQTVPIYLEANGTTEAYESVDVRARVKGFLNSVNFRENDSVTAQTVLYTIDPREFDAAIEQAEAAVALAQTESALAKTEWERAVKTNQATPGSFSEEEVQRRKASYDVAESKIRVAKSEVTTAKLDRSYTEVKAGLDGTVGKSLVDQGNLVGDAEATLLTTVVRTDPIYATFNINESDYLKISDSFRNYLRALEVAVVDGKDSGDPQIDDMAQKLRAALQAEFERRDQLKKEVDSGPPMPMPAPDDDAPASDDPEAELEQAARPLTPQEELNELNAKITNIIKDTLRVNFHFELRRRNDKGFPFKGYLDYAALEVERTTGSFELRAEFKNDGEPRLTPGLFVRVRFVVNQVQDATLIPQLAVATDQTGKYVLVVNSDGTVERRTVELGPEIEHMQVIASGLELTDQVITDGLQRARPGAKVEFKEETLELLDLDSGKDDAVAEEEDDS